MDPRELSKEIPKAKKTMAFTNRHHLMQVRNALTGRFKPTVVSCSPASELSEKMWALLANQFPLHTAETTAHNPDNQSTESDSDDPSTSSSVSDALLEKIEKVKKIRIAPIKRASTMSSGMMAPNKVDKDDHDTGGSGTGNGAEKGDLLEAKLEVKISGTSSELWTRLEKVVRHVVAERFAVFEKNIEDLGTRMLKIEKAIKQQEPTCSPSSSTRVQGPGFGAMAAAVVPQQEQSVYTSDSTSSDCCGDVGNPEKADGEENSCQTNSKDVRDLCLIAPCASSVGPPKLQTNTAPGNITIPVGSALLPCLAQPASCSASLTCLTQPQGHGQHQQDVSTGQPHHVQNVLGSLTATAAYPFPFSQMMSQASTQQEASVHIPTTLPSLGYSDAGRMMPAQCFTTAYNLNQGLVAPGVPEPLISPATHSSDNEVGDEVGGCCEGSSVCQIFTLDPPPSLPRLVSLLCLDQLPQDALLTPVPGQPELRIVNLPDGCGAHLEHASGRPCRSYPCAQVPPVCLPSDHLSCSSAGGLDECRSVPAQEFTHDLQAQQHSTRL